MAETPPPVSVTIDGTTIEVAPHTLVIRAAESLGITIPRFCDHPLLDPVAACRQCLVEVEGQRKPLAACSTTCTPGMVVKTQRTSEMALDAQEAQLEFLLINHPLDCPQCDKGGECPLQDQALAHGPGDSRMVDEKRRYDKPVPISPQVSLDRERCVLCARCTRFSKEISGDPFIELFERGALEQVAIYADAPYVSYFSGNVVQICPVGALTSNSYRFGSRPFDLRRSAGIAYQDASGAALRIDSRRGVIQRQLAAETMATNESWLDDKNRYGYAFVAHPDRLTVPLVRSPLGTMEETSWPAAVRHAAERLRAILEQHGPQSVAVLTGGRLTDEDAYAVSRYAREVLGTDHVDFRTDPRGDEEVAFLAAVASTAGPTYADVEAAPVIVVAGLDAEEELPTLYLRLRKAWRKRRAKIVVVGPFVGCYREIAWRWVPTAPGHEAAALRSLTDHEDIAAALGNPGAVVLAGERLAQSPGALTAAGALAQQVGAQLGWVPRRPGARGAVEAGLAPGLLPGGRATGDLPWARTPDFEGKDARGILEAAAAGEIKALHLIGVDPARDFADPRLARAALEKVELLIVADLMPTETVRYADVVLPACAPPERTGSFTSWEGRRQAVAAVGRAARPAAAGLGHPRRAGPRARRRPALGDRGGRAPRGRPAADARRPHHRAPRRSRRRRQRRPRRPPMAACTPSSCPTCWAAGPCSPVPRSCWRPRGPRPPGCTPTTRRRPASCTARPSRSVAPAACSSCSRRSPSSSSPAAS